MFCKLAGFLIGVFLFRYLGIPMTAKHINAVDSKVLMDNMIKRIRALQIEIYLMLVELNW